MTKHDLKIFKSTQIQKKLYQLIRNEQVEFMPKYSFKLSIILFIK